MRAKVVFAFLIVAYLLGCACQGEQLQEQPKTIANLVKLNLSDTSVYITAHAKELGTLYEGETIAGSFNLENCSDETLNIKELSVSCGCMSVDYRDARRIEAGEIAEIKYTINTSLKSGDEFFDILIITSTGKYVIEMTAYVKSKK